MPQTFALKQAAAADTPVLQLCHSYGQPFLDVARQTVSLFHDLPVALTTVYLTGTADADLARATGGEEVIFLEFSSRQIRGLKRAAIASVRAICRQRGMRFAVAHRYKPIYVASHIPGLFVVGVHHAFGDYQRFSRRWYVNRRRRNLALLGVSDAVRDDVRSRLPRWPAERIETLYNRVDYIALKQSLLPRQQARQLLDIPDGSFVFANVGRLHPDKDQATLIAAFARVASELADARLLIIGKGRLQRDLQRQIEDLSLQDRVRLTGPIADASRLFSAFDGFVLSSDHEPFGMVLLEAMAAGLPIVASDCGGASEVVADTGWLFALGNVEALAERMRLVYALDTQQRALWAQRMDQRVQQLFTLEAGARTFRNFAFVQPYLPAAADDSP
jgi:glycosyltransferase involved in cell wall biosynthesis